ncbi:hypothetical protein MMC20_003988 [Loxospora ochrophaea]|nr:hypothetical protein [Loxospora ochrophaea]
MSEQVYDPPPGPPPADGRTAQEPPPYHDWTSVPDTSTLPPPPSLENETSPTSNAQRSEADRAHDWCQRRLLVRPHQPSEAQVRAVSNGDVGLSKPLEYSGDLRILSPGVWKGSTKSASKDSCILTSLPLYFATTDSPLHTERKKTTYFEVKIQSLGRGRGNTECSLALGYAAVPYPSWRMPGWERGSLAVHTDDGRRYVNDTWGGKDFTAPIQAGDTVGIGMTFSLPDPSSHFEATPPSYGASPLTNISLKGEVFFTRNGKVDGSWDLHEELDADNEFGVVGLDGQFDLYGAIGVFGGVEFQISFNRQTWLWQP